MLSLVKPLPDGRGSDQDTPPPFWIATPVVRTKRMTEDGFSLNVIAQRKSPTMFVTEPMFEWLDLGDRFVSMYTYGPLGLITRTEEMDNWSAADNRDHYYLPDAYGGNVAMAADHDGDPQTNCVAKFTISDTFGNAMAATIPETGMYAWRGQEGSVTDGSPGLVLMYLRHYDPTIGRFIQADILPVASLTSQGMGWLHHRGRRSHGATTRNVHRAGYGDLLGGPRAGRLRAPSGRRGRLQVAAASVRCPAGQASRRVCGWASCAA